jgi:hypothetical protein
MRSMPTGEHTGEEIFRPLSQLESLVGIEDQRLDERLGLVVTRLRDGIEGWVAFCR